MSATPLRFALSGAAGRMGKAILQVSHDLPNTTPTLLIDRQCSAESEAGPIRCQTWSGEQTEFDVLIDFSSPKGVINHLTHCLRLQKPMIIGVTGLTDEDHQTLQTAAEKLPILLSANMSLGVNLCFKLAALARAALPLDFDAEIFEIHHKHKRDAPSGTALALGQAIAEAMRQTHSQPIEIKQEMRVSGVGEPRDPHSIGHGALRGGEVVGEHTAFFFGDGERIEITHRATDRKIFARGALQAALWLKSQPPGLYSMLNVLGF